jgi:hypothetical protein
MPSWIILNWTGFLFFFILFNFLASAGKRRQAPASAGKRRQAPGKRRP